jgi:hypothetical protein
MNLHYKLMQTAKMDAKRPKNDLKTAEKKTAEKRSTRKQAEIHPETTRKQHRPPTKYANHCRVSYPDAMYLDARACAHQLGVSIQELQRKAMEAYLAATLVKNVMI